MVLFQIKIPMVTSNPCPGVFFCQIYDYFTQPAPRPVQSISGNAHVSVCLSVCKLKFKKLLLAFVLYIATK